MDQKGKEIRALMSLDKLLQLIKNTKKSGRFTESKIYENYYDNIRLREGMTKLIKGTIHEIK